MISLKRGSNSQSFLPSINYPPWQIMHSLQVHIFNLCQLCRRLDSLAQWLKHCVVFQQDGQGLNPTNDWDFFSYSLKLYYSFHVVRLQNFSSDSLQAGLTMVTINIQWTNNIFFFRNNMYCQAFNQILVYSFNVNMDFKNIKVM